MQLNLIQPLIDALCFCSYYWWLERKIFNYFYNNLCFFLFSPFMETICYFKNIALQLDPYFNLWLRFQEINRGAHFVNNAQTRLLVFSKSVLNGCLVQTFLSLCCFFSWITWLVFLNFIVHEAQISSNCRWAAIVVRSLICQLRTWDENKNRPHSIILECMLQRKSN